MKLVLVAGARPNFIKLKPVHDFILEKGMDDIHIVHTGQHYDFMMSGGFFDELSIPKPSINLGIGSGTASWQTAQIMVKFEKYVHNQLPDLVIVFGDVNSTLACSLVCSKMGVPIAHVEAGLRSNNWQMPEEINRVVTDRLSDYLFTPSRDADTNLIREGISREKIFFVGNVMVDTLLKFKKQAKSSRIIEKHSLIPQDYSLITLHRPSNVDGRESLDKIVRLLISFSAETELVFPLHPRTRRNLENYDLLDKLANHENIKLLEPLGYLDFIKLIMEAKIVVTDSGGIQEETTVLGVPCLTLREETERPVTVSLGTNKVVGTDYTKVLYEFRNGLNSPKGGSIPELWDGKSAERIADVIANISG